ncbi:SH3 domain-containing protein [Virgibacillus sp. MSP4-1]|uniref:cell wall-binding repeat-containing protein n=1 Tax=Virgibacillus sp. MSP4-1 TaxID=2700081 RepID=UPI0003A721C7|nr:cell wall-binding repeat-containing protein [Virgibacillus sp. MSP4-1]QHS23529.1 SH3 domain-containing protein [Virgibacillus sp. MSP4-1]
MMESIYRYDLLSDDWGGYTLNVYISNSFLTEFAAESGEITEDSPVIKRNFLERVRKKFPKTAIKTINIIAGSIVLASIPFGHFQVSAHEADFNMSYLFVGGTTNFINDVNKSGDVLDTLAPSYFELNEDGTLKETWQLDQKFIDEMHARGKEVVPFVTNHWDKELGRAALANREELSTQIANSIKKYNLDGVNVDIENVTDIDRGNYTDFVRLLREKIPKDKEVSVAVAANPNNWSKGWHGSYDYKALSQYSDYLMIMAYDQSYPNGPEGPVASYGWVEKSIQYALNEGVPSDKIVLGLPFFGRYWEEGNTAAGQGGGKGISNNRVQQMLDKYQYELTFDEVSKSPKATVTIKETDPSFTFSGTTLGPGTYHVWYENEESIQAKMDLVHKYNLKGTGSWSLGQENPVIWNYYDTWTKVHSNELNNIINVEKKYAKTTGNVNFRSYGSTTSNIIKSIPPGETIKIVGQSFQNDNYSWVPVELGDGTNGYVAANYLQEIPSKNIYGSTRYETSVKVSQEGWTSGSEVVVLGRGDLPADALTGSVLAKKYNSPLLLTKTDKLPSVVENEIARLRPNKIYILGGENAVSPGIKNHLEEKGYQVERVNGTTRYETSAKVAEELTKSSEVFIATGDDRSPDALSIAPYAGMKESPIILSKKDKLPDETITYMKDNGITKVTIIGGEGAISKNVEEQLNEIGIHDIERVNGTDRHSTSVAIAKRYASEFSLTNIYFASGISFIDALPGSPLAAMSGQPVILANKSGEMHTSIKSYLQNLNQPVDTTFLGGYNPISENIRFQIVNEIHQ